MVICDSSSLIHLAGIGRLGLLRELYGKLIVPTAVWREIKSRHNRTVETAQSVTTALSETIDRRAVSTLVSPPPAQLPGNEPATFHGRRDAP